MREQLYNQVILLTRIKSDYGGTVWREMWSCAALPQCPISQQSQFGLAPFTHILIGRNTVSMTQVMYDHQAVHRDNDQGKEFLIRMVNLIRKISFGNNLSRLI